MTFESILKTLEREKVGYAIVGGVAVVLYGYVRLTKDIDIVIDFSPDNVSRLIKVLKTLNFKPGVPIDPHDLGSADKRKMWIEQKNAQVITFYNPESPFLQIDILLTKALSQIKTIRKKIGDFEITLVDYDELLKMKRQLARPIDLLDVEKLEALRKMD